MEKKNQFKDDLRRVQCKRGKLLNEAEKVPEKQKEVAKTTEYAVGCITENEVYTNDRISRKDFVRSIYQ